jgi:starch synthase
VPAIFTIHNLAYQGLFEPQWLPRLDLPWDLFSIDRAEFWGRISFLKGGINDADLVTTVSPQYAREIQTRELGFGFDGILRRRRADLVGILNGIDTERWDPARDPFLPAHYHADDVRGKLACKREVLRRYGLPIDDAAMARPLVGMISRMVDQKGFDLIAPIADRLAGLPATWVVLGTGEPRYQDMWTALRTRNADRIGVHIGFDEQLAHLIEAGADIFLMPSRFEPCGLNQMYSLRYGTVPVVHGVGGLLDTVRDDEAGGEPNGFVFRQYTPDYLLETLERALAAFADRPRWMRLQRAGMRQDNSWDHSAAEYVKIYERALLARRRDTAANSRTN